MAEVVVLKGGNGRQKRLRRVMLRDFHWLAPHRGIGCRQLASDCYQRHSLHPVTRRTSKPECVEHLDTWARSSTSFTMRNTGVIIRSDKEPQGDDRRRGEGQGSHLEPR